MAKEDLHVRIETAIMQPVRDYATRNGVSVAAAVSIVLLYGLHTLRADEPEQEMQR